MKHILFLSMGKDSMALFIKVVELGLPLDEVVFCDIRYNKKISGEMPIMANWIPKAEKIIKEKFNIEVKHITSEKTFEEFFYTIKNKGKHSGENYGFPYTIGAWCNDRLKLQPIKKYLHSIKEPITEYIGIAKDEPKRLERYKKLQTETHKYITLADFNITEAEAVEICRKHNLLSPVYDSSFRGGCWFCVKQPLSQLYNIFTNYPDLWEELKKLEKNSNVSFKPNKTLEQIELKFKEKKYGK